MRHLLANVFTYILIIGLLLMAAGFAWVRSQQIVLGHENDGDLHLPGAEAPPSAEDWLAFGERTYRVSCQNCHTVDGSGRGMYPPIQRMTEHLTVDGGRGYLLDVTLHGLYTGTYGAPMPPMPELSDAEVAAVNNYILVRFAARGEGLQEDRWYLPAEVAGRRNKEWSEWDVADRRPDIPSAQELGRDFQVPIATDAPAVPEGKDD